MPTPRRTAAVLALAAVLVAFPLGVLGSHQYADVPNSNPFHGDIAAITNAGVTSGCGGGNYCPDRNVTRAEMAAFMNRLGALAANKTPVVNADRVDGMDSSRFAPKRFGQFIADGTTVSAHLGDAVFSVSCASISISAPSGADLWTDAGSFSAGPNPSASVTFSKFYIGSATNSTGQVGWWHAYVFYSEGGCLPFFTGLWDTLTAVA